MTRDLKVGVFGDPSVVGPEPGCLSDPCPACASAGSSVPSFAGAPGVDPEPVPSSPESPAREGRAPSITDADRESYPYRYGQLASAARLFLKTGSARELDDLRRLVNAAHESEPSYAAHPVTEQDCARLADRLRADQRREKDAARIFDRIAHDGGGQ